MRSNIIMSGLDPVRDMAKPYASARGEKLPKTCLVSKIPPDRSVIGLTNAGAMAYVSEVVAA